MNSNISRRNFIGAMGCASLSALPFLNTWFSLNKMNAAAGASMESNNDEEYKALVCILLGGGNDSFNMLVPKGSSEHFAYAQTRSNLTLPKFSLLPIESQLQQGIELGLHPNIPEIQQLYNDKKLAFITNIGTLVEHTDRAAFFSQQAKLPLGLFSHSDQVQQWQTSIPQDRSAIGWGGRLADMMSYTNENQNISMNISLSGNNVFQAGRQTVEYTIDAFNGAKTINNYNGTGYFNQVLKRSIDGMLEQEYHNIFEKTYANTIRVGLNANEQFAAAISEVPRFSTTFSGLGLSAELRMVAQTIAARDTLQMKRQVFFIHVGGWDHHDEVINIHGEMMGQVSRALGEFQATMEELGIADQVTTFSISDFARTLSSNGNGSDHGWGGNVLVMGGAVKGGEVYGKYPTLALSSSLDVGGGVLIPTISTDEYFAELALWMGVSPNDLSMVFPNIGNFYSVASNDQPIGFLKK
ncbi:MAG: DUF1501 domain-containing protein [Bacteroidota bacterium]